VLPSGGCLSVDPGWSGRPGCQVIGQFRSRQGSSLRRLKGRMGRSESNPDPSDALWTLMASTESPGSRPARRASRPGMGRTRSIPTLLSLPNTRSWIGLADFVGRELRERDLRVRCRLHGLIALSEPTTGKVKVPGDSKCRRSYTQRSVGSRRRYHFSDSISNGGHLLQRVP
jgi:hypothetical protein